MADEEQLKILRSDVKAWNAWREHNPSAKIALQGAMLNGADLRGANLCGADLRNVNLEFADLREADLEGVNLQSTELLGTRIQGATGLDDEVLRLAFVRGASVDAIVQKQFLDEMLSRDTSSIRRSIEFPPDYREAGIAVLSYFATYVEHRYPDEKVTVQIEQNGLQVMLTIKAPDGRIEVVEKALQEYGLVVIGQARASDVLVNPAHISRLERHLEFANIHLDGSRSLARLIGRDFHPVSVQIQEAVSAELIEHLQRNPRSMRTMHPRKFEQLVAEILRDMGYDVELTPATADGGRDVLAYVDTPLGRRLTLVECKRYSEKRKVGVSLVREFLYVVLNEDSANHGLIATTSAFSVPARALEQKHQWRLGLKDFDAISEWLARYGTWENEERSGLWLPHGLAGGPEPDEEG